MEYLPWARSFSYHSHPSLPSLLSRQGLPDSLTASTWNMPESHAQSPPALLCSNLCKSIFLIMLQSCFKILLLSTTANAVFTSMVLHVQFPLVGVFLPTYPRRKLIFICPHTAQPLFLLWCFPSTRALMCTYTHTQVSDGANPSLLCVTAASNTVCMTHNALL